MHALSLPDKSRGSQLLMKIYKQHLVTLHTENILLMSMEMASVMDCKYPATLQDVARTLFNSQTHIIKTKCNPL